MEEEEEKNVGGVDDSKITTIQDLSTMIMSTEKVEDSLEHSKVQLSVSEENPVVAPENDVAPSNESNATMTMTATATTTLPEEESVSAVKQIEREFERLALESEGKPTSIVTEDSTIEKASLTKIPTRPPSMVYGIYFIRDIYFRGKRRRFLMQNDNGPCPLLAVCKKES
jgi:hypothetical protein